MARGDSNTYQIVPIVNNATAATPDADLGHGTAPWQDLYLHGGVYFDGDTATNKLDAYEEGVWTPAYTTTNGDGTFTHDTVRKGYYTVIGDVVHASFRLRTDAVSGGTGNLLISGLPFASKNVTSAGQSGSLVVGRSHNFGTYFPIGGYVNDAASSITVVALSSLNTNTVTAVSNILLDGGNKNDLMAHVTYKKA